jgi:hypothetical protein
MLVIYPSSEAIYFDAAIELNGKSEPNLRARLE